MTFDQWWATNLGTRGTAAEVARVAWDAATAAAVRTIRAAADGLERDIEDGAIVYADRPIARGQVVILRVVARHIEEGVRE